MTDPTPEQEPRRGEPIKVLYRNWRGETAIRTITPWGVEWGSTDFHPEPQWLLTCLDHDKSAGRTYALRDCDFTVEEGEALRDRALKAETALWECVKLSGADTSEGVPPTWPPLHELAVREVGRLRQDYDEACEDAYRKLRKGLPRTQDPRHPDLTAAAHAIRRPRPFA